MKKFLFMIFPIILSANVKNISNVIVYGGVNVVIKHAKGSDNLHLSSNPKADAKIVGSSVLIKPNNYIFRNKNASAEINLTSPLEYLEVQGDSNVILDGAKTKDLRIVNSGTGHISLKGNLNIRKISQSKSGTVRALWVNSDQLEIESSYGEIELAGRCSTLKILGHKSAVVNTQYLRCKNTWVRAQDYATVKVSPVSEFKVWATDNSKVYYTKMLDYLKRDLLSLDNSLVIHVSSDLF